MKLWLYFIFNCLLVMTYAESETHPCKRKCVAGKSKTCKYHFVLETYYSMSPKACYKCPEVKEDCYRQDCIVGGGIKRNIITANRQFPGPAIEVCQFDTIEVTVENAIMNDESTAIHWHGFLQKGTPYMDGVPYVTQCPILANSNFTYTIVATESGTHFWHSHEKMQRGDGLYGFIIVNVPDDPHKNLYDEDLIEHQISIIDWTLHTRIDAYGDFMHGGGLPAPDGILINGLGYMNLENIDTRLPIANLTVEKGKRYRLRLVNAAFFDCPFVFSIDNHNFTVISSDGHNVKPQPVSYFNFFPGERMDVILCADQDIDTYWIRVQGLAMCKAKGLFQIGILTYKNSPREMPTADFPTFNTSIPSTGLYFNPLLGNETNTLLINQLVPLEKFDARLRTSNVVRKFIKISFNPVENPTSYRYPYYGYHQVAPELQLVTPMMNDIGYLEPPLPLLLNRNEFGPDSFCNNETAYAEKNCTVEYCHCTHVVELPLNRVIELVLYDNGVRADHHPMHLHGFKFRVVAWKKVAEFISRSDIENLDRKGLIKRNFKNPLIKDTIAVPRGGYAIIRFFTDNPGFWIFHCHVDIHADDGMRMVFKVGNNEDMEDPPKDFPRCRSFPKK